MKIKNYHCQKHCLFWAIFFQFFLCLLISCTSEWESSDPEAKEKTEQLRKEYNAKLLGSWNREILNENHKFFEQIAFYENGTYSLYRKWQMRTNKEVDWEELTEKSITGDFEGKWKLIWQRQNESEGKNMLFLGSSLLIFYDIIDEKLIIGADYLMDDGIAIYARGNGKPSF